jgi:hypothetical protein
MSVTSYEQTSALLAEDHPLEEVQVYDTRGKAVSPKKLPGLLKGETFVLVSADGKPVDPLYLRLVKEGTLVFVLPAPPTPPPVPPAPAPGVTERPAR